MEQYYTFEDVCEILPYKRSYIYKLMHEGKIPYYKPTGGKAVFSPSEIDAFIKRGKKASAEELNDRAMTILEQLNSSPRPTFKPSVKTKKGTRGIKANALGAPRCLVSRSVA